MKNSNISVEDFIKRYESEKNMYNAWGEFVADYVIKELELLKYNTDSLIKIPVKPRVKETDSIIEKAFIRKEYSNPYDDITDKVGVRFVVLIESQIKVLSKIIESSTHWSFSEDRDYIREKEENPQLFTYQSVHYVIRNNNKFEYNTYTIEKDIPCEVQIRTLEQHAYAEISHEIVYKKNRNDDKKIDRFLARSMALNEATDDLFERVYTLIEEKKENYYNFINKFSDICDFPDSSDKLNKSLFDMIEKIINDHKITPEEVADFVNQKKFIVARVKEKQMNNILYKQPVIILLYYLAKYHSNELESIWDMTEDYLMPIYSDLGISFGET